MADDRDLPTAAINRIVKDSLPDGVNVAKDAKMALVKAAKQFIIHATQYSNDVTLKKKRKTMAGEHVIEAMADMEFGEFQDVLKESLEMFHKEQGDKKTNKANKKAAAAKEEEHEEEEEEDDDEEAGDSEED